MTRKDFGGGTVFLGAATLVVLATLAVAVTVMESPRQARERRIDQHRIEDLRAIASALSLYWENHDGRLPADLGPVAEAYDLEEQLSDPVTGEPYAYRLLDNGHVELCATFATVEPPIGEDWARDRDFWSHPEGDHCWELVKERLAP